MTARSNEALPRRHANDLVHRVPQRVLPLLVGPQRLQRIGLCADRPTCGHFWSIDRIAIEQFSDALRGGQGALGIGKAWGQRWVRGQEAEQCPSQSLDRPWIVGRSFGADGVKVEFVGKPKANVGENGLTVSVAVEFVAKLFDEPVTGASGGHDDDVRQKRVGQWGAQTLGQEGQQLLR